MSPVPATDVLPETAATESTTPTHEQNGATDVNTAAPTKARRKAAKKATKAPKAKKAAKPKAAAKPRERKAGWLPGPQVRILKLLSKGKALARADIAAKAEVDGAFCSQYLGRLDDAKRVAADKKYGFPSLITLKGIKAEQHQIKDKDVVLFSITATGSKLLERAEAATE